MTPRVAASPCSYGVFEFTVGRPGLPDGPALVEAMADGGYAGSELGPPGYLGTGREVGRLLAAHDLELVGCVPAAALRARRRVRRGHARAREAPSASWPTPRRDASGPSCCSPTRAASPTACVSPAPSRAHPEAWLGERAAAPALRQRAPRGRALPRARLRAVVPSPRGQLHRDAARGLRAARAHGHEPARPLLRHRPLGLRRRRSAGAPARGGRARQPRAPQGRRPRAAGAPARGGQGPRGRLGGRRVLRARQRRRARRRVPAGSCSPSATTRWIVVEQDRVLAPGEAFDAVLESAERNRAWLRDRGL